MTSQSTVIKCEPTEAPVQSYQTIVTHDYYQRDQFEKLKDAFKLIKLENKDLKNVILSGKHLFNKISAEKDDLQQKLNLICGKYEQEKQFFVKQIEDLKKEVLSRDSGISQFNARFIQLQNHYLEEKTNSHMTIQKLYNERETLIKQLNDSTAKHQKDFEDFQAKMEENMTKMKIKVDNQEKFKKRIEKLEEENLWLNETINKLKKEKKSIEPSRRSLRVAIKNEPVEPVLNPEEINQFNLKLIIENENMTKKMQQLKTKYDQQFDLVAKIMDQFKQEKEIYNKQLENFQQREQVVNSLQVEIDRLKKQLSTQENVKKEETLSDNKDESNKLQNELDLIKIALNFKESRIIKCQSELSEARLKYNKLEFDYFELKNQLDKSDDENKYLNLVIENFKRNNNCLKSIKSENI